jgi:hypothetical protein
VRRSAASSRTMAAAMPAAPAATSWRTSSRNRSSEKAVRRSRWFAIARREGAAARLDLAMGRAV